MPLSDSVIPFTLLTCPRVGNKCRSQRRISFLGLPFLDFTLPLEAMTSFLVRTFLAPISCSCCRHSTSLAPLLFPIFLGVLLAFVTRIWCWHGGLANLALAIPGLIWPICMESDEGQAKARLVR